MEYLPKAEKEILKLPRSYIANIIHTVVGKPFLVWTQERIKSRNEKVVQDKDLSITMDKKIYEVFKASNAVSVSAQKPSLIRPLMLCLFVLGVQRHQLTPTEGQRQ